MRYQKWSCVISYRTLPTIPILDRWKLSLTQGRKGFEIRLWFLVILPSIASSTSITFQVLDPGAVYPV